jgi:hypothetical protein
VYFLSNFLLRAIARRPKVRARRRQQQQRQRGGGEELLAVRRIFLFEEQMEKKKTPLLSLPESWLVEGWA